MKLKREIIALYLLDDPDIIYLEKSIMNSRSIYKEDENYVSKIIAYNERIVDEKNETKWKYNLKSDLPSLKTSVYKCKALSEQIRSHINEVHPNCRIESIRVHRSDVNRMDVCTDCGDVEYYLSGKAPAWNVSGGELNELMNFNLSTSLEHDMLSKWYKWCYDNSRMSTKLLMDKISLPENLSWDWYNRQKVGGHTGVFISDYSSNNITHLRDLLDGVWRTSPPDRQNIWKRVSRHILYTHFMNKFQNRMKRDILEGIIETIQSEDKNMYYLTHKGFCKIKYDKDAIWSEGDGILSEDKDSIEVKGGRFKIRAKIDTGKSPMYSYPRLEMIVSYEI